MEDKIIMEVPYFQTPNEIYEIGLNAYEISVYTYLCRCGNNGGKAFPSYKTIAEKCGMSKRKAIDTVKALIERKLLYKLTRYNESAGENYSNIYKVNLKIEGSEYHALGGEQNALGSVEDAPYKEIDYKEPTKKNLLHLSEMHNPYVDKYVEVINRNGYKQKKVSPTNYRKIEREIKEFYYLPIDDFETLVEDYIREVHSDGDILYFLKANKRVI